MAADGSYSVALTVRSAPTGRCGAEAEQLDRSAPPLALRSAACLSPRLGAGSSFINVPIGIVAALMTARLVPHVRHHQDTLIPDLFGGALLVLAVGSLALGLVQRPVWGWGSASTIISFVVAAVSAVAFILRSTRANEFEN